MSALLHVDGYIYFKMEIEGVSLPPSPNLVDAIAINQGTVSAVPILTIQFFEESKQFARELAMSEGTKAHVEIGRGSKDSNAYTVDFRLFGHKQSQSSSGPRAVISFILDCPKYATGAYRESVKGTSSAALSQVAGKGGLGFSGPRSTPNDFMTWLNIGKTRSSFAEEIAMHGYVSEQSCMARVVTDKKKMLYKDLFEEIQQEPKATFCMNTKTGKGKLIAVRESKEASVSGVMNGWLNYGFTYIHHTLEGTTVKIDRVNPRKTGPYLPINSEVKGEVGDISRVEYCARLDCGSKEGKPGNNVHPYYNQAYYQNLRYLALFGEKIHVITDEQTGIELFDCVEFQQADQIGKKFESNPKLSGTYIVSNKVIFVKVGIRYCEKFELIRPCITEAGKTPLV